jgi:hypothetical protein
MGGFLDVFFSVNVTRVKRETNIKADKDRQIWRKREKESVKESLREI